MAYDIETARTRAGLESTDTSKDDLLNGAMQAAQSYAEKYCDRFFSLQDDVAEEIHFTHHEIQLHRFPLVSITSVMADGKPVVTDYHMNKTIGMVVFDARLCTHTVLISYSGGYSPLPGDLEMALWRLFDSYYGAFSESGVDPSGATGAIKAISSSGARVEFDVSSGGSNAIANGLSDPFAMSILNLYALKSC